MPFHLDLKINVLAEIWLSPNFTDDGKNLQCMTLLQRGRLHETRGGVTVCININLKPVTTRSAKST